MKPHPTPDYHPVQRLQDEDGRITCFSCSHVFDEGYTGLSITNMARSAPLSLGRVHDIVCLVPEPVAALEDDEFASAGGLGA